MATNTIHEGIERLRTMYAARGPGSDLEVIRWALDELHETRKALLALAAGAHGEDTVGGAWVVQVALQGLGVDSPMDVRPDPPVGS